MAVFVPFTSDAQVSEIASSFLDRTLPRSQWTHAAHFAATLWLLSTRPHAEVARDLPDHIRSYNQATGLPNTDLKGYHETITQASLRATIWLLAHSPPGPLFATCNALMRSPLGRPEWLLEYWSRPLLFTAEARREWIDPDLAAFPYP
jgi:hypothetical protein